MTLIWKGEQVTADVKAMLADALTEFGLTHETAAKGQLSPGHGVVSGTLRRSIHAAYPTYAFGQDDVPPSGSSPERSGRGGSAGVFKTKVSIVVGSGMAYAARIEDLYAYITQAHEQVIGNLPGIIEKHAGRRGLK